LRSKLYGVGTFYAGVVKQTPAITMAGFRTFSAHPNAMISAAQCRSARALLGWSVAKLASAASVSVSAIDDFEAEQRAPVPAVRRAHPARFRAGRRRVSARRRRPPAPRRTVRGRRRPRVHSHATYPQKPRLTAGIIWRDHMLKIFGTEVLPASALAITAGAAFALQTIVRQVDKNTDGSVPTTSPSSWTRARACAGRVESCG